MISLESVDNDADELSSVGLEHFNDLDEFHDVQAPLSGLGFGHEGLRFLELLRQLFLGQMRSFARLNQLCEKRAIGLAVDRFSHFHAGLERWRGKS